ALRGVFPAGSYVHVMQSKEASEIFGAPENLVDEGNSDVPNINKVSQDAAAKPTAFTYSFANVLNRSAAVAIPIEAVEEVFDHTNEKCPKNPKKDVPIPETDDGFTMVNKGETSKKNDKEVNCNNGSAKQSAPKVTNVNSVPTTNSFGVLSGDELETMGTTIINEDSDYEALDEELIINDRNGRTGLNFSLKQNEVRQDWSSNGAWCDKGTRIILGWNHNEANIYKEKTRKIHDSKIKIKNRVFNVGDRVLLFSSRLKIFPRKLKNRWTGPFRVAQVFPYETVELSQTDGPNFKVNGKRGLRQGDPLSPYLFTLVMEILMRMLKRRVTGSNSFSYHRYCEKLKLVNLCFTNDLFLFAYGNVESARVLMEGLMEFKQASNLVPSLPKSTAYFCNVLNHIKISILIVLPFEEGRLPVKYLEVSLVSSRLMVRDLFILPNQVLLDIEQIMKNFLWCPSDSSRGKAKVTWDVEGVLTWPQDLMGKYPSLSTCTAPTSTESDQLVWRFDDGTVKSFSVNQVWCAIRPRDSNVMCLDRVSHDVYDVIAHFGMNAKRKSTHVVIAKMVLAASTYFIWQERNWRLFKKSKRQVNQVHIEVLSVLWGNRLSIPDGSLPLSSLLKGRGSPGRNRTPGPWSARIPMWQLFKGLGGNGYSKKDKIEAKTDKTEHGMENREKSKSTKSKSTKVKVKDGVETEEMLNWLTRTHLMGRPLPTTPAADSATNVLAKWNAIYDAYNEVACLILGSMTPELHKQFENSSPYDMIKELLFMFEKQAGVMKGYVDQLERLGNMLPQDLVVGLILNGLTKDFVRFVRNYNMHNMGKTIGELHAMLIEYENGLPKKAETPQVMMIKGGKIHKDKKKSLKAKGKGKANGKGNDKQVYIPKPKNPKPSAKDYPAKDDTYHHCKEVGHWKMICPVYLAELLKKRKQVGSASSSESATRILNMVPTKKVDKTPYKLWYGKVPNFSYLKVRGCEALVKRDTPDKLQQRSVKYIFIGYLKETIVPNFSYLKVWGCEALVKRDTPDKLQQRSVKYIFIGYLKETIVVARYAEFFEKNLITQKVSGRAVGLEKIQDEDTSPSEITSEIPMNVKGFKPPQEEVILIYSYKAAMLDSESNKWIDAMNAEIQFVIDNMVWVLVDHPPRLVAKGYTQLYEVDYEETFSPVADIKAIRILIYIAAFYDYEMWKMDIKNDFLNVYIVEDIYMVQPEGFVDPIILEKYASFKDSFMVVSKHQEAGIKDLMRKSNGFVLLKILMTMCISKG
nr:hypothetical protein [Tanacetum cinerariifolium]